MVIGRIQTSGYSFNLPEMGGAVADLGTTLLLMLALILLNGLNATAVLVLAGLLSYFVLQSVSGRAGWRTPTG